ncbi:hypothetical protein Ancab_038985 [Ancistrocladus abbreviatus]
MHGREGENKKRIRHMYSVPSRGSTTTTVAIDSKSSSNSFFKDVRKISVGDCALFKPPHDSPPFIGIIRRLASDKESNLRLGVNWLYRPAEITLGKGVALEAAPNEVFYSFHRDEIPAASLLHPCKVSFLPKGVELPTGVSSFVCRRVYDITNKCLWWLTDQDYIDDRQEEVDQLLYKTRLEMHATVQQQQQQGGRSPKQTSGPTSTSQLKHSPDSVQNSGGSLPSQPKGKKRERSDQVSEPLKRERLSKTDDGDIGHLKSESLLKSELAKITERGGLVDFEGVERLVQLMQPEKPDKKVDLTCRSLLAGVIAATDKLDCLSRFMQLRGLPVLDEWLQEVHKGKVGDSSSPRDSDRSVEEFLLVLLRALDKLPVNLNALQMCNIGKSVNHLRTQRNSEIQRKARSLVDTWKKRVEVEMNTNDAKSGSGQAVPWSARSRHEVSHGGNRQLGGSSDAVIRSSLTQLSSSKSASVKLVHGEANAKSSSGSPGAVKSSLPASPTTNFKDGQSRMPVGGGNSEMPQSATREEKSSSSSLSHTNSQCSIEHARNLVPSGKDDTRSSTAGSTSMSKVTSSASRYRRSPNGLHGVSASGIQREAGSSRNSSSVKISAPEKLLQSPVTTGDALVTEGNNHKLIVKIPNRGRSPAQSASGGSIEDPSFTNSRASSPVLSEKNDESEHSLREKNDSYRTVIASEVNTESWQSNDLKDVGSDEGDGSPAAAPDSERCQTGDDTVKLTDIPKDMSFASGNEMKSRKPLDSSFSSINALIESCVKYSEANEPVLDDDVGMNLLASVAAGEISKSDVASPIDSPPAAADEACMDNNGTSQANDDDPGSHSSTSRKDLPQRSESHLRSNGKSDDLVGTVAFTVSSMCAVQKTLGDDDGERFREKKASIQDEGQDLATDGKPMDCNTETDNKDDVTSPKEEIPKREVVDSASCLSVKVDDEKKKNVNQGLSSNASIEHKSSVEVSSSQPMTENEPAKVPIGADKELLAENFDSMKAKDTDTGEVETCSQVDQGGKRRTEQENVASPNPQKLEENMSNDEVLDSKEAVRHGCSGSASQDMSIFASEKEPSSTYKSPKAESVEGADNQEHVSRDFDVAALHSVSSGMDGKLEFDLNEGLNLDDGKCAEPVNAPPPAFHTSIQLIGPMPMFSAPSASVGIPASVTVAAAAKGPFVPPDDLLRNKGELGWKGSAATSAFRPAEPRKVAEMPGNSLLTDGAASRQARPPLDIDLNVADEMVFEDMGCHSSTQVIAEPKNDGVLTGGPTGTASLRSTGGLDLDLNRVDDAPELGQQSTNNGHRLEVPLRPAKTSSSSGFSNGEAGTRRNFDLNNGPAVDETITEPSSYNLPARANFPIQPPARINNIEIGNLSSWYPPGSTYSAVPISSLLPDRGEQPFPVVGAASGQQRILGGPTGSTPFNPDAYRGPVLSSSAAMPFPSSPFQYSVFPFGTSFPLPSSTFSVGSTAYMDLSSSGRLCIPAVPSQLIGAAAVSSQYPRPYVVTVPDVSNNGAVDSSRKLGRQGLDLNAGPGVPDIEGRDEALTIPSRQVPGTNPLSLTEEQSRMYHMAGSVLKRKEPEGGWDTDRLSFKHSSWQ